MKMKHLIRFILLTLFGIGVGSTIILGNNQPTNAAPKDNIIIHLQGSRITFSGIATADFNNDGYKEMVVGGSDGILYVVGTLNGVDWQTLWSRQINNDLLVRCPSGDTGLCPADPKSSNRIESMPAIADLDNDGHLDIVVTVGGDIHSDYSNRDNGGVLVYRYNSAWNFSVVEPLSIDKTHGWPQPRIDQVGDGPGFSDPDGLWDGIRTSPTLADLDGDGDLEIIVEGIDRRIHAWHHTGEAVAGWPISQWNGDPLWRGGLSSPAAGDLDNDGLSEVVVGTMSPPDQSNYNLATVWALNGDSTSVNNFPITVEQQIFSSPALADLDHDGWLEVIFSSGTGTSGANNKVYVYRHDGTPYPGWPQTTAGMTLAPPAVGDIDNDGELEIVVGCGWVVSNNCNRLYAWNADGSLIFDVVPPYLNDANGFSLPYTPILADYDGDGTVEIIIAHHWGLAVTIVEPNGITSDSTTRRTYMGGMWAAPIVDDIDGDGLLEIAVGGEGLDSKGAIYIFDENGSVSSKQPWPMFHQNVARTGLVEQDPQLANIEDVIFFHDINNTEVVSHTQTKILKNDGGGTFEWNASHSIQNLQVTPMSGSVSDKQTIEFTYTVSPIGSGLFSGWNNVGDITITATNEAGDSIDGSPLVIPVKVFVGTVNRIYLPLVLR